MAIDFPNSPALNDTFTVGSSVWQFDGSKWLSLGIAGPTGATGATGPQASPDSDNIIIGFRVFS